MKAFQKFVIAYTVFALAALAAILLYYRGMELSTGNVASYSAQELEIYKQVWEQVGEGFQRSRSETLIFSVVLWGVTMLVGYLFLLFIYLAMIRPAREMEEFAAQIAKGNLDLPLPIHKWNAFGRFTESFDLMRDELRAAKEREQEAEKAKREMVAELSHDLKTPVATIKATCEVMDLKLTMKLEKAEREHAKLLERQDEVTGDEDLRLSKDKLTQIEENIREIMENLEKISYITNKAETIHQLVGNVFRATLDDMQEIKVEPRENDSRLIEGCFKSLREYGNVILENHVPECLAYFDRLRMEQVIDNVVGNAYKYAGTDVRVSFEETESLPDKDGTSKRYIKIKIRDFGPGVPKEELPLLTQKFYRGKNAQERQGYGLGLYLVKWYMERQGGGLEYYNDHGFVVELLVKKV